MAQFTVYRNTNPKTREAFPYFVDVQSALLEPLNSRVVIPLSPLAMIGQPPASGLCPSFEIEQQPCVLMTHELTSVPVSLLADPVTSLDHARLGVLSAIDLLITGI